MKRSSPMSEAQNPGGVNPAPPSTPGQVTSPSAAAPSEALLAAMMQRLERLEGEVSTLRLALEASPAKAQGQVAPPPVAPPSITPPPFVAPPPVATPPPVAAAPPSVSPPPPPQAHPQQAQPPTPTPPSPTPPANVTEQTFGLAWLNYIGVITVIIGVGFLFKLAVDYDWIGPMGRLLVGVVAGFAALVSGTLIFRRGHKLYAQGVFALGLGILFLTFYAGFAFYQILPASAAMGLLALTVTVGGWLAYRHQAQNLLLLSLFLGYLAPPLVRQSQPHHEFFLSYMLCLHVACLWVARLSNWSVPKWTVWCTAPLALLSWVVIAGGEANMFGTVAIIGHIFLLAYFLPQIAACFSLFALGLTILIQTHLSGSGRPEEPIVQLVLLTAALLFAVRRAWPYFATAASLTFYFASFFWITSNFQTPDIKLVELTAGFGTLLFYLVATMRDRIESISLLASNGMLFLAASYALLLHHHMEQWQSLFCVAVAMTYAALAYSVWDRVERSISRATALGMAGVCIALALANYLDNKHIALGWSVQAAAIAYAAARWKKPLALLGAVVLAMLAALLVWADPETSYRISAEQPPIWNNRFLTMAANAVALLWCAYVAKRHELEMPYLPEWVPAVAGHVLLVLAVWVEAISLARKAFPGHSAAAEAGCGTLVIGVYAGLLLLGGMQSRDYAHRMLGLGLLAIGLLKLYLVDVWVLSLPWRVIAFIGLGALLLGSSWLYARRKKQIEALWAKNQVG